MSDNAVWLVGGLLVIVGGYVLLDRYAGERVDRLLAELFGEKDDAKRVTYVKTQRLPGGGEVQIVQHTTPLADRIDAYLATAQRVSYPPSEEVAREAQLEVLRGPIDEWVIGWLEGSWALPDATPRWRETA